MQASRPPIVDWRALTDRESRVAALSVTGGVGAALAGVAVLAQAADNYTHAGFLDGILEAMIVGGVMFTAGAYAGASLLWLGSRRERDFSPALVTIGAGLGGAIGGSLLAPMAGMVLLELSPFVALAAAWAGARLACRATFSMPAPGHRRWGRVVAIATAGLLVAGFAGAGRTDFPGAAAPTAERRAWGVKTFGRAYENAEAYVRTSAIVADRLGPLQAIAPTEGTNRTATSPGELMGEFTLELVGAKGTGVAHLRFMHGSSDPALESYGFTGELKTPDGPVALPPLD